MLLCCINGCRIFLGTKAEVPEGGERLVFLIKICSVFHIIKVRDRQSQERLGLMGIEEREMEQHEQIICERYICRLLKK